MGTRPKTRSSVSLLGLDTIELRDRLAKGACRAEEVARAALDAIKAREPEIGAWTWFEEDHALAEASRLDALRVSGRPIGPLHGLPVGVKDIIDTRGIPTCNGTEIDSGRVPTADATVIARLRAAGALIIGKTVTTELAFLHPGKTRNPADPSHTPGGSSQGSAAAVAAGMVPLAVGTQTGGSVIRPASFCGVVGYKPSFGMIPRTGVLAQSPTLDTIGVFATSVPAAALIADAMWGHDAGDPSTSPVAPPRLLEAAGSRVPVRPTFAMLTALPVGVETEADMNAAMEELAATLGESVFTFQLPDAFGEASAARERINFAEMAKCFYRYERLGRDRLSNVMQETLDRGKAISARDYLSALDWRTVLNAALDEVFDRADAILAPATPGAAPKGLETTGSPAFNGLWTLCGTPVVSLPAFEASNGLPMGLQVIGRRGDDGRLLRTAHWLWKELTTHEGGSDHG